MQCPIIVVKYRFNNACFIAKTQLLYDVVLQYEAVWLENHMSLESNYRKYELPSDIPTGILILPRQ